MNLKDDLSIQLFINYLSQFVPYKEIYILIMVQILLIRIHN